MKFIFDIVIGVLNNFTMMSVVYAWLLAQTLKIIYYYFKDGEINFAHFVEAGGMPSSHSAMISAAALGVGLSYGWTSPAFALGVTAALIIMYDAAGVRRAAGKQALILNRLIEDIYTSGKVNEEKLKEIIGHTPFEVIVGSTLGIIVTLIHYYACFIR